jgi:hypothetical protein
VRIHELYGRHKGADVYVLGTGPSLRCLDLAYFADKVTVGLNQAWKHLPTTYSITVHPELVLEYEKANGQNTQWVVKKKPPMADLKLSHPRYYVYGTSYSPAAVRERPDDTLYLGEGVQTTAMDFAARLGAAAIVLVGCDAACLGGDYHAHDQHVRWVGRTPDAQYKMYRDSAAGVREVLRPMGVRVMTLTPFIGAGAAAEDYARLRGELGLAPLPAPRDVSPPDWKPPKR